MTDESYSYDANGNRTMSGYSTTANNQLTTDGTYNYTYDDEGNRLTRTKISNGKIEEYIWDHRNRLPKSRLRWPPIKTPMSVSSTWSRPPP